MNKAQLYQLDVYVPQKAMDCYVAALDEYASAVTMALIEEGPYKGQWKVSAIFEQQPDKAALSCALAVAAAATGVAEQDICILPIANKDWLKESLQNFPPLDLGRYYVYGSHLRDVVVPEGKIGLKIDAATAFGSGKHATTQGCLLAFEDVLQTRNISTILDMGCGSGILSMAAAKVLPNVLIDAVDIDDESVKVTQKNIIENNVASQINVFQSDAFAQVDKKYDLIFANILARPLIEMASDMYQHVNHGGFAILSGFLNRQNSWLAKSFEQKGFSFVKRYKVKEWSTVIVKKS